ncbi:MAG: esterase-like activity of phytase family protein [Pseudomonadota bacterium]
MIGTLLLSAALLARPMAITLEPFSGLDGGMEVGCMTMTSGHALRGPSGFGGYSGVSFDDASQTIFMLSDAGHIVQASLKLQKNGALESLTDASAYKMRRADRTEIKGNDTEAFARYGNGWLISRERAHDLVYVTEANGQYNQGEAIAELSALEPFTRNGSLEALTSLGDGRYLLIAEDTDEQNQAKVMMWRESGAELHALYQSEPNFNVTDMHADLEGDRLFVLERAFSRKLGPRARINVLKLSDVLNAEPDTVLKPQNLGRMTFFEGADNMEGITLVRAEDGSDVLLLVSDDNFNAIQRTVLMTLTIGDSCPLATP